MWTSQTAKEAGVNAQTLRYYERRGLLARPPRRGSGYREYPADAVGVLFPFGGILISPIWASAAMTLSSLSVIVNALRLRKAHL